jgi:hypothetical protein
MVVLQCLLRIKAPLDFSHLQYLLDIHGSQHHGKRIMEHGKEIVLEIPYPFYTLLHHKGVDVIPLQILHLG